MSFFKRTGLLDATNGHMTVLLFPGLFGSVLCKVLGHGPLSCHTSHRGNNQDLRMPLALCFVAALPRSPQPFGHSGYLVT